jgi:hypothetical protein
MHERRSGLFDYITCRCSQCSLVTLDLYARTARNFDKYLAFWSRISADGTDHILLTNHRSVVSTRLLSRIFGSAGPKHVQIFGYSDQTRRQYVDSGGWRSTAAHARIKRKHHSNQSIDGECHSKPHGGVARRVVEKLLQFTCGRMYVLDSIQRNAWIRRFSV